MTALTRPAFAARGCLTMIVLCGLTSAAWSQPKPEKQLFAKSFLGKKPPKLIVDKWLTKQPKTEGKVVLLDFWATWCGPCRKSIKHLNKLHAKFKDRLVIIGLSDEPPKTIEWFMVKHRMDYAVATDPRGRTRNAYGVKGIPHVVIIGTDGLVKWEGFPNQPGFELTEEVVAKILDADEGLKKAATKPANGKKG